MTTTKTTAIKYNKNDTPGTYRVTWREDGNKADAKYPDYAYTEPRENYPDWNWKLAACERDILASNSRDAARKIQLGSLGGTKRWAVRASRYFATVDERIAHIDAQIAELQVAREQLAKDGVVQVSRRQI